MKIRVYYEDTDCGNVVYYANYLKYMERSRTEYLRDAGIDLALLRKEGIQFVVVSVACTYRGSACYDDLLDVSSLVKEMTSVTITFKTEIRNEKDVLLVSGDVKLACIGSDGKARKIPIEVASVMNKSGTNN